MQVNRGPRQDLLRIAGYAGVLFFALLVFQMITYRIVGADLRTETD